MISPFVLVRRARLVALSSLFALATACSGSSTAPSDSPSFVALQLLYTTGFQWPVPVNRVVGVMAFAVDAGGVYHEPAPGSVVWSSSNPAALRLVGSAGTSVTFFMPTAGAADLHA